MDNSEDPKNSTALPVLEGLPDKAGLVLPDQILPPNLFILPVNHAVIYPTLMSPLLVTQPRFVATIEEAINRQRLIGLMLTKDSEVRDNIAPDDLHQTGVIVKILKR